MDRTSWQTIKCGIKLTILLSILLWSGILVVGLHRQYQLLAKAKDQVEKDLVGFGFSSSKMAEKQSAGLSRAAHCGGGGAEDLAPECQALSAR